MHGGAAGKVPIDCLAACVDCQEVESEWGCMGGGGVLGKGRVKREGRRYAGGGRWDWRSFAPLDPEPPGRHFTFTPRLIFCNSKRARQNQIVPL